MTDVPSITSDKKVWGEKLRETANRIIFLDWYFSGWLEKIILVIALSWSAYSLEQWLVRLIGGLL